MKEYALESFDSVIKYSIWRGRTLRREIDLLLNNCNLIDGTGG